MSKARQYLSVAAIAGMAIAAGSMSLMVGETETVTKASAKDIHEILSENVEEVLRQIELENVEVSLPIDGKAPRVLVRVEKGNSDKVPKSIIIEHRSEKLEVPLEVSETFEQYEAG